MKTDARYTRPRVFNLESRISNLFSKQLYLDFRTDQSNLVMFDQTGKIKSKIRPLHEIYRLKLENSQLTIWYLDDEKFGKQIETGIIKLAHQEEPFSLITAGSQLLRTHGESEELFDELGTYRRAVN